MMGIEFTGRVPFHTVYLHGIIRDSNGEKMSKTKGNVVDPIHTVEEYGCDALRSALVQGTSAGQDVLLDMERVRLQRNFVNKLWNAGKYIDISLSSLSSSELSTLIVSRHLTSSEISSYQLAERYIISRCHEVCGEVTKQLESHLFAEALKSVSDFIWDEFADWYLEVSKTRVSLSPSGELNPNYIQSKRVLVYVWDTSLRLLHPFMPFVTETLWQISPHFGESLMLQSWPLQRSSSELPVDKIAISHFSFLRSIIKGVRNTRAEYSVDGKKKIPAKLVLRGLGEQHLSNLREMIIGEKESLCLLARINPAQFDCINGDTETVPADTRYIRVLINETCEVFIPTDSMIDRVKETVRLTSQIEKLKATINPLKLRLESEGFISKASPTLIDGVRKAVREKQEQLIILERRRKEYE